MIWNVRLYGMIVAISMEANCRMSKFSNQYHSYVPEIGCSYIEQGAGEGTFTNNTQVDAKVVIYWPYNEW